jgi:hypothetical protein
MAAMAIVAFSFVFIIVFTIFPGLKIRPGGYTQKSTKVILNGKDYLSDFPSSVSLRKDSTQAHSTRSMFSEMMPNLLFAGAT